MHKAPNKKSNALIHETSPYLLQHAYNPVDWVSFSEAAFTRAKEENKLVLISIGYSACHWCHVMEHECFEDLEVATLMNKHFVNIKVDREERSDVDMLYMQAVQLMTGHGGWPLNCFVLPDGKPFYGGTYFNKQQWKNILQNLADIHANDPKKIQEYATELTNGVKQAELINTQNKNSAVFTKADLNKSVLKWKGRLDQKNGGPNKAPKFPMPSNYLFLLRYALLEKDEELLKHVQLTLDKMAFGGIYDQLRGGFARYSTDLIWKVPHFEKMLYDNAQLVALYTEAFLVTKNELYKEVVYDTLNFIENEWYNSDGYFYSAFDADSEGEEGKYYVWNVADLKDLLHENYTVFSKYFQINENGYWEQGNYILMRSENLAEVLAEFNLSKVALEEKITVCKAALIQESKSRIKPGLDDKCITAWNALMCSAFAKAYLAFGEEKYKRIALSSIKFIEDYLIGKDGKICRCFKNGQSKIDAFLDDYAFVIDAYIQCYLVSQDEKHLKSAAELCERSLVLFENPNAVFLFYTANTSEQLVARTSEISDNVIPASNSQMAINLFYLGKYFEKPDWITKSQKMLDAVTEEFTAYGAGYSHWGILGLHFNYPFKEVAIVGNNVDEKLHELYKQGLTNTILAPSYSESELPLIKNRYVKNQTLFYVCENNTCKIPVDSVDAVLGQLD
jgi:uncharacterized protein